jgi:hypothetical protein
VLRTNKLSNNERGTLLVECWKQSTKVQQHFNDISMKVRNFAVVIFTTIITGVGLSLHKGIYLTIHDYQLSVAFLLSITGLLVTQLIHFMDTYWYHILLKGAVNETQKLEKEIKKILRIDTLAEGISSASQGVKIVSIFGKIHFPISYSPIFEQTPLHYILKGVPVDSTLRHKIFYRWLLSIIFLIATTTFFIEPIKTNEPMALPVLSNHSHNIISGDNVRLRTSPSIKSDISIHLPVGQRVYILSDDNSTWLKVLILNEANYKIGYVHRDFINTIK